MARRYLLAMAVALGLCGCAHLNIGVDVYKGDLLLNEDGKLAKAAGEARMAYQLAREYASTKNRGIPLIGTMNEILPSDWATNEKPDDPATTKLDQYIERCIQAYTDDRIDERWAEFSKLAPPGDNSSAEARQSYMNARHSLEMSLFHFGSICVALGQERGVQDALALNLGVGHAIESLQNMTNDRPTNLKTGIVLEEAGANIILMVDDSEGSSKGQQSIAHLMQSVTTGLVAETASHGIIGGTMSALADFPKDVDARSWANINNIEVSGIGGEKYVIIKDEIGNWHIKSLVSDETAVVNAVFDTTTDFVNVIASHYGLGASTSGEQSDNGTNSTATVMSSFVQTQTDLGNAQQARAELNKANSALRTSLGAALADQTSTTMHDAVISAITLYAAEVQNISFTPSSGAATTPQASGTQTGSSTGGSSAGTSATKGNTNSSGTSGKTAQ